MKHNVVIGQTDYTVLVFIPDSASTDGSGKTGLVAANLTVSGVRVETDNDVTVIDYTASLNNLALLTTAHTDWGLLEVSATLAPGLYRLDLADAIFAAGAWSAVVYVMVTTSAAAASPMEFILDASDFTVAKATPTNITAGTITTVGTLTTYTGNTPQTGDSFARIGAPAGASVSADVAAVKVDTAAILVDTAEIGVAGAGLTNINLPNQTMDIVGNITGNLSGTVGSVTGAVGSVTGAVGSVTGNVGGNVTGTVGSVVGAVGSVAGNVGGNVVGTVASVVGAVGSVTGNVGGNVTGSVGSVVGIAVKKNTALAKFEFLMVDATDFATPETGVVVTATRSIDGAAFGACANAVAELSNGIYVIDLAAADLNGTVITLRFTGAGCADRFVTIATQT